MLKSKTPIKRKRIKPSIKEQGVKKALASVNASLAIEGLKPSKITVNLGKQYLEGKISAQEAIGKVKEKYLKHRNA